MKRTAVCLAILCCVASSALAQLSTNRMMKIVTRDTSPGIPFGSFAAKPKVLYRMGETYGRIEEMLDREQGIHGLVVIAEPKCWMINLFDKSGRLILDPGPTYVFRASIIPSIERGKPPPLPEFEFGTEYAFLNKHRATRSQAVVNEKKTDKLSLSMDGFSVELLSEEGRDQPWRVIVTREKKILCQYDYDEYKADLEPRMELFKPPSGVLISRTDN
jgi:hypothetical protein